MGIRFKSATHARIFIFAFSGTCLGVYFSPVFYYAFVRPYKEEHGYPIKEPLQKPDLYPFVAVRPGN